MADQTPPKNPSASDEIDLGQLLELIKKGIKNFGNFFLRIFIYLKRNALKLGGLVLLGLAISFGLNQIISKQLKTDVIVRPNFESKNYLFDVVEELAANIKSRNERFIQELGITEKDLEGFNVEVEAIEEEEIKTEEVVLNEMKYLEVLQNFKDESFVIDILRSELSEKSVIDYKITFTYKDPVSGPVLVQKLMTQINTNEYFNDLKNVYEGNAKARIEKNTVLIAQIDELVGNYSKALLAEKQKSGTGVVYMEKENTLNVPSLLDLKNELLKEIEDKRLEMAQQKQVINILNFGKTQQVSKSFFNQTYFLIPTILVVGFIVLSFFKYLERKAKEIE
jgi:sensor c-di-GMP phosphodiesterase-like protein